MVITMQHKYTAKCRNYVPHVDLHLSASRVDINQGRCLKAKVLFNRYGTVKQDKTRCCRDDEADLEIEILMSQA